MITDATSCVGGNTLSFARAGLRYVSRVNGVEIDPRRFRMLCHNLALFGVPVVVADPAADSDATDAALQTTDARAALSSSSSAAGSGSGSGSVSGNAPVVAFEGGFGGALLRRLARGSDAVFADPPWGGPEYRFQRAVALRLGALGAGELALAVRRESEGEQGAGDSVDSADSLDAQSQAQDSQVQAQMRDADNDKDADTDAAAADAVRRPATRCRGPSRRRCRVVVIKCPNNVDEHSVVLPLMAAAVQGDSGGDNSDGGSGERAVDWAEVPFVARLRYSHVTFFVFAFPLECNGSERNDGGRDTHSARDRERSSRSDRERSGRGSGRDRERDRARDREQEHASFARLFTCAYVDGRRNDDDEDDDDNSAADSAAAHSPIHSHSESSEDSSCVRARSRFFRPSDPCHSVALLRDPSAADLGAFARALAADRAAAESAGSMAAPLHWFRLHPGRERIVEQLLQQQRQQQTQGPLQTQWGPQARTSSSSGRGRPSDRGRDRERSSDRERDGGAVWSKASGFERKSSGGGAASDRFSDRDRLSDRERASGREHRDHTSSWGRVSSGSGSKPQSSRNGDKDRSSNTSSNRSGSRDRSRDRDRARRRSSRSRSRSRSRDHGRDSKRDRNDRDRHDRERSRERKVRDRSDRGHADRSRDRSRDRSDRGLSDRDRERSAPPRRRERSLSRSRSQSPPRRERQRPRSRSPRRDRSRDRDDRDRNSSSRNGSASARQ